MAEEKDQISELKKLTPEARLKKLKEIEEKSKKEIEAAQKLIKESEEEITEKKKFEEKVPIPQLIAEGEKGLESKEEKEMLKAQREKGIRRAEEKPKEKRQEVSLEDQLRLEHIEELTNKPSAELKEMMADIYKQAAKQDGYMTREQREDFYSITKAEQNKIYAMKEGQYPKEQMGSALEHISASFSMGQRLRQMYSDKGGGNDNPDYQRGGY